MSQSFPNALGTQCWGNTLTGDPTADRKNHPSCSQEEVPEGRGPSIGFLGSGKAGASGMCSPWCPDPWQPSVPLPWSWHSLPGGRGWDSSDGLVTLVLPPLTANHDSEGETELPSAPSSGEAAGTGNLWDQCVKAAGSWCGMRQDQLRSCPAQPGMPQPRAFGCQAPGMNLSLAVPAGRGSLALALGCAQLWSTVAVPGWEYLANSPLHYLAVAGSKTPPLAFTTHFHSKG